MNECSHLNFCVLEEHHLGNYPYDVCSCLDCGISFHFMKPPKSPMNDRIGKISQSITPNFGFCLCCETAWSFVVQHITLYDEVNGCFPMCELCWEERTPLERLPFYRTLYEKWENESILANIDIDVELWDKFKNAVLNGK